MDPIGTTLAAVSLTFQVFSSCMAGYQLLSDAKNMPKEFEYLLVRLKTEQHRLLDWAHVAGISETDETLSKSVARLNRQLLLDILHQKETLLLSFGKLDSRYKKVLEKPLLVNEAPPAYSEPHQQLTRRGTFQDRFPGQDALMEKALTFIETTRRYPMRLRWATFDREKFEKLLLRLNTLNNFMKELLDAQQQHVLRQAHQETQLQIVQLNNKLDYLVQIFQSTSAFVAKRGGLTADPFQRILQSLDIPTTADIEDEDLPLYEQHDLAKLARFKGLNTAIDQNKLDDATTTNLDLGQVLNNLELDRNGLRLTNPNVKPVHNREEAEYNGERVWVEWKRYDPDPSNEKDEPPQYIARRVRQLAILLHDTQKPEEFRAPRCLGYFDDRADTRFGLVFSTPPSTPPSSPPIPLTSLFKVTTPSLTSRIALARAITNCIRYLHSTNWLHKGLRSHNIIFFATPTSPYDLANPTLAGFDYARPARSEEMTERPPENPEYDIYRHPATHGDGPLESYKKPFDIYSLGVILAEIAHWKPIDQIVGIEDLARAKPGRTKAVRDNLLDDHLESIQFSVGDMYHEAVVKCLKGDFAGLGVKGLKDYKEEVHGARLQTEFYDGVVKKLGGIHTGG